MSAPLNNVPDPERELFTTIVNVASGFPTEVVVGAAANMLVNAMRQSHATQRNALNGFDEVMAKTRALLAEHYDGTGKRRNVFPHHQIIDVPFISRKQ